MELTEAEKAWLGAVVSSSGTFQNTKIIRKQKAGRSLSYRYEVRSKRHPGLIRRFSELAGKTLVMRRMNYEHVPAVSFQGDELHELMKTIWQYVTKERQHEYAEVRKTSNMSKLEEIDANA